MSIRARAGLLIASSFLVFSVSACSGTASQDPQDIARQNVCAALGNLASSLLQLQGVDVQAIGPENLAPQINNILSSWGTLQTTLTAFAASSPEAPDEAAIEAVRTTGLALEASLAGDRQGSPDPGAGRRREGLRAGVLGRLPGRLRRAGVRPDDGVAAGGLDPPDVAAARRGVGRITQGLRPGDRQLRPRLPS